MPTNNGTGACFVPVADQEATILSICSSGKGKLIVVF